MPFVPDPFPSPLGPENPTVTPSPGPLLALLVALAAPHEPFVEFVRATGREATVEVDADRPAPTPIPPTLFGTFTENIGDAVYGGLWAQILHNPSLEPDYLDVRNTLDAANHGRLVTDPSFGSGYVRVEPLAQDDPPGRFARSSALGLPLPWEPLRPAGVRYEPRDGDVPNSHRALLMMGLEGREVGIRQGVYLPVHRTRRYVGSLWARVGAAVEGAGPVDLAIGLRRRDRPDEVLAGAAVRVAGTVWARHEFRFELLEGKVASLEKLDFAIALEGDGRVETDNVLLWPADHVEGFDPEVLEAAKALKTPLLRFGGNFASGYHWRDGVGDPERRKTVLNQAWGLPEYNHFGTDEFLRLCRMIGAEPQICVNAGSGEPDEAASWVEYGNGTPTTKYGAMRAVNGHTEPYGVRYWEVGNELWGDFQIGWQTAAGNARRYPAFATAIRRADPGARLIATGGDVDSYRDWNAALIAGAGAELDLISTHLVIGMQPAEQLRKGADDAFTHRADLAVPVGVGRALDAMHEQIEADPQTRGRVKLAFTEWQFWSPRPEDPRFTNLGGAVNSAAFFHMLMRRVEFVPVSNMSNLVQFAGIHRQRGRVFVTPSYHVLRLYGEARGGRILPVRLSAPAYDVREGNRRLPEIANVPEVDALAVLAGDGASLRVFLVNRSPTDAIPTRLSIRGFLASRGTVRRLSADRLDAANDPEGPGRVAVEESGVDDPARNAIELRLPPHSISVITLERK